MSLRLLLACITMLAVSACTTAPTRPDQVILTRDMLTVRMTSGATCRGPAPASGAETGWSGQLQACPVPLDYTVQIQPGTNPVRFVLTEFFGSIGLGDALQPVATVTFPTPGGPTRVFRTPDPTVFD